MSKATIGFIGLGVMGEPMCRNFMAKSGRKVRVFDLDAARLRTGARIAPFRESAGGTRARARRPAGSHETGPDLRRSGDFGGQIDARVGGGVRRARRALSGCAGG